MKRIVSLALIVVLALSCTSCVLVEAFIYGFQRGWEIGDCSNPDEHELLYDQIDLSSVYTPYATLYSLYMDAITHQNACSCDFNYSGLLEYMIYGKWESVSGYSIELRQFYYDYYDTVPFVWLSIYLPSIGFREYSVETENEKLIFYFADDDLEEKTKSLEITFAMDHIIVKNLLNGSTYNLFLDTSAEKVVTGLSMHAFDCITNNFDSFAYPEEIKILSCWVDFNDKTVNTVINYKNSSGESVEGEFVFYYENGVYGVDEVNHSYSDSNVDVEELNSKLKDEFK